MSAVINAISSLIIFVSVIIFTGAGAARTTESSIVSAPAIELVPVASPVVQIDPAKREFIAECTRYGFDAKACGEIWDNDASEQEAAGQHNLIQVDNREYTERRAEVLSRPDAVVFHATIR